jgi:hypothetical protein
MQMQQLKFVKHLEVEKARYVVQDDQGEEFVLLVDYKMNSFIIERFETITNVEFGEEVQKLATGLLARKHGKNLAKREQYF